MKRQHQKILILVLTLLLVLIGGKIYTQRQVENEAIEVEQTAETVSPTHTELVYFLVLPHEDMSGDISRYMTGIHTEIPITPDTTPASNIREALEILFAIPTDRIPDTELENMLAPSDLHVRSISVDPTGLHRIDLMGTIMGIGTLADPFIKLQITKTIEAYTDNYIVTLNGSEAEWRCSLDMSGLCE